MPSISQTSSQSYVSDPRNEGVLVYVDGTFVPRDRATVSIFDAGFVLGDGVWEGLRLVRGKLIACDDHMDRLYEGAATIQLDIGLTREELVAAVRATLDRNGMTDGAHIRLMVTRGRKTTVNQDPCFALGPATILGPAASADDAPSAAMRMAAAQVSVRCGPDIDVSPCGGRRCRRSAGHRAPMPSGYTAA